MKQKPTSPLAAKILGILAILFGGVTVLSGGGALFGGAAGSEAAGDAVWFVLWFNFVAGFFYVLAGVGLMGVRHWAAWLAASIAGATVCIFAAFAIHVAQGGPYEARTVGAMVLRSSFWIGVAIYAFRSRFARFAGRVGRRG